MATTTLELPGAQLPNAPSPDPHPAVEKPWRPRINPWIVAMTVTLATFMEVLDSSIANVALPHIAGGLGATQDEATWVLTAYLVANAIILPAGAYMTTFIGRKKFYMICVAFMGNTLYALLAGAGCSHGLADTRNGVLRVNADGSTTMVANLSTFQKSPPVANPQPDDFEPD